jgi:AcrR family transcriptional regulator
MESGFRLFAEKGIDQVTMPDIAEDSGVGRPSLYRYFSSKVDLVIAIGTWKWAECLREYTQRVPEEQMARMNGREHLQFYLDSFLDLYRNHRDVLRFNHYFNSYIENERATPEQMQPYMKVADELFTRFHAVYQKAMEDGTLRTDMPETTMLSSMLHIMLAAATRYAGGLVYVMEGTNPEDELVLLRDALLREFTAD